MVTKISIFRSKSSLALILAIIILLLLIPSWYVILVPTVVASEIEKMDTTTSYVGTLGKEEFTEFLDDIVASEIEKTDMTTSYEGTLYYFGYGPGSPKFPIRIEAHVYVDEVKGDNINLKIEANMLNMTNPDNPNTLEEFSYVLTYVIDKFTLENVPDAPDADKERTGYDPLYPRHLKVGEEIQEVWLDNLNVTGTLEYQGTTEEEGLELYEYLVDKSITKEMWIPDFKAFRNLTLVSTKTLLIEPLTGVLASTENETLKVYMLYKAQPPIKLVDLTYKSTEEARAEGIELAKQSYEDLEFLEFLHSGTTLQIEGQAKAEGIEGDNVIVKIDAEMIRSDTGESLPDFAQHSKYVFNKFTRENDPEAPDADKSRYGYDPLYPSHLKKGEKITAWFDMLNTTGILEYEESIRENGLTLYRYSGSKTITQQTFMGYPDSTLSLARTVLIEPLSGLPAYTENETFCFNTTRTGYPSLPLVYLTYESTAEAKTDGLGTAKTAYDGMQLLELYIPTIVGIIIVLLIVGLFFNVRRLKRKASH